MQGFENGERLESTLAKLRLQTSKSAWKRASRAWDQSSMRQRERTFGPRVGDVCRCRPDGPSFT